MTTTTIKRSDVKTDQQWIVACWTAENACADMLDVEIGGVWCTRYVFRGGDIIDFIYDI